MYRISVSNSCCGTMPLARFRTGCTARACESPARQCRNPQARRSQAVRGRHSAALAALLMALLLTTFAGAVSKPHTISFGKWMNVDWIAGVSGTQQVLTLKIRPLIIDAR